jgi:hypothetical protein
MISSIAWLLVGLILGVIVSIIFYEKIAEANKKWLLFRGRAIRGSYVKGKIYDSSNDEKDSMRPMDKVVHDGWWGFELYMPYKNMDEYHPDKNPEGMDIKQSDALIKEAIFNKYNRNYHGKSFRMNAATRKNVIIPIEKLDMKVPK